MFRSLLPTSLLALVFASPTFSAPSSPNDPFRDIALQAPKPEELPVCCLRPLEPVEPSAGDDVFISFEDWKAKRLSEAREHPPATSPSTRHVRKPAVGKDRVEGPGTDNTSSPIPIAGAAQGSGQQDTADVPPPHEERLAPQLRIPIVDRFNYASTDCSARVHAVHRTAKSPSSILSSKKDRYMLSPCAEEKQFVVVELCDDIMIDTVQLANYEFFSGVFKDFSVSVAKTPPTGDEGWTHAGTYRARNVRGVQVCIVALCVASRIHNYTYRRSILRQPCATSTASSGSTSARTTATNTTALCPYFVSTALHTLSSGNGMSGKNRVEPVEQLEMQAQLRKARRNRRRRFMFPSSNRRSLTRLRWTKWTRRTPNSPRTPETWLTGIAHRLLHSGRTRLQLPNSLQSKNFSVPKRHNLLSLLRRSLPRPQRTPLSIPPQLP